MGALDNDNVKRLFHCISELETEEECRAFFEDICTIKEVLDMTQRLDTAIQLDKGDNYQTISKDVGVSTATISRVRRCLDYGAGGYRLAIDRMKEAGEL